MRLPLAFFDPTVCESLRIFGKSTVALSARLVVICLLLASCGRSAPIPPTALPSSVPAVAPTLAPAPTSTQVAAPTLGSASNPDVPKTGGSVSIWLPEEPSVLSPILSDGDMQNLISGLIVEGLVARDAKGAYIPVLADALPEVSGDGLTLTYHLKKGVKFSNGNPFTCADVQFTWKAIMSPLALYSRSGYERIKTIDCKDEATAVINFEVGFYDYLSLFSFIIPTSAGTLDKLRDWDYHTAPIGTGPWMVSEWQVGDHLLLIRNPYFREQGKPYLDQVVLKFLAGHENTLDLLRKGEIDVLWGLTETSLVNLPDLSSIGVQVSRAQSGRIEMLLFNLADPAQFAPADASAHPHPILGDVKVRQAIQLAIHKQALVDSLFAGQVEVSETPLSVGTYTCQGQTFEYNPDKAKVLLEEAGWKPGADGIRQKGNARLSLKITAQAEDSTREKLETALVSELKGIGIELVIANVPVKKFTAGWREQGLRLYGQFDILLNTSDPELNPAAGLRRVFESSRIPSVANGGKGANFSRYKNSQVDTWIDQVVDTTNLEKQNELYCQISAQINQDAPAVFLYEQQKIVLYRARVHNLALTSGPAGFTLGSQDWWVDP